MRVNEITADISVGLGKELEVYTVKVWLHPETSDEMVDIYEGRCGSKVTMPYNHFLSISGIAQDIHQKVRK